MTYIYFNVELHWT